MPRSSFSERPLLRVSRPVSACSRCRSAKVKCDGKLPACTACEKAGRDSECSAANDQFARGKERSYVAALEARVEKLERQLQYARMRKASVALHEEDEVPPNEVKERNDSLANIRAAIHRKAARKREDEDMDTLISDLGYMAVNAASGNFDSSQSNMTFAQFVLAGCANEPLPESMETPRYQLPSRQSTSMLAQHYMSNIFPLFPAFPPTTVFSLLDCLYSASPQPPLRSPDAWLLWVVLAIGSMSQSQSKGDKFYNDGVDFVTRALPYADRALTPSRESLVLSLLLLTQYAMLDPTHFDSWNLIGFTCQSLIDLGFHEDPPQNSSTDKAKIGQRRMLFHSVYALDRAISMVYARTFSFTDDEVSVALPIRDETSTSSIDTGLVLFRLRRLQSHWYQTLFQSNPDEPLPDLSSFVWKNCGDMSDWAASWPSSLPVSIREMLGLELRYSYVYCIAPSARAPQMTPYGRMLIFEHGIAYLDRIYEVASTTMNTAFYTYHDALRVYFIGSQFVAVLRDDADMLLSGINVPIPLTLPEEPLPPPPPTRFDLLVDNIDRSLRALERTILTLEKFGNRWEDASALMGSFDLMSSEVRSRLKKRKAMRDAGTTVHGVSMAPNSQLAAQQMMPLQPPPPLLQPGGADPQPAQGVEWVDLHVAHIGWCGEAEV